MRNKRILILGLVTTALLMGILSLAVYRNLLDCKNLIRVTPIAGNSLEISATALERLNGQSFLLTYEIFSQERVQALNSNYDITLIKTNYAYPLIMHKLVPRGSFFTEKDQKEKKKAAILNKTAAYTLFGSTDICGMKVRIGKDDFTITGIIDDLNDKKSNLYIPAACSGENPRSFIVQMEDQLTEAKVENQCKTVASTKNGYRFVHYRTLADLVLGFDFIVLKIIAIIALVSLIKKGSHMLRGSVKKLRQLSESLYMKEIIGKNPKEVIKAALVATAMIVMTIFILSLAFSFIDYFMLLRDTYHKLL